jgi:hypothetical protein
VDTYTIGNNAEGQLVADFKSDKIDPHTTHQSTLLSSSSRILMTLAKTSTTSVRFSEYQDLVSFIRFVDQIRPIPTVAIRPLGPTVPNNL